MIERQFEIAGALCTEDQVGKRSTSGAGAEKQPGDNHVMPAAGLMDGGQQRLLLDALSAQRSHYMTQQLKLAETALPASGLALKAHLLGPSSGFQATLATALERMQPSGLSAVASAHGSAYRQTLAALDKIQQSGRIGVVGLSAAQINPAMRAIADSTSPLSKLSEQLKYPPGLAQFLRTAEGPNNLTPDWMNRLGVGSNLASIRALDLVGIGVTANLGSVRSLLGVSTTASPYVDRIGSGWTSLSNRFLRGNLELAPLIPGANRLAATAYRLDLLGNGDELAPGDEELLDTRTDGIDIAGEWLGGLTASLGERWDGVWDRMHQRGADWRSQAANSAVELMDELLQVLAPDDEVRQWQAGQGKYSGSDWYLKKGTKGPVRRLRLYYLGSCYNVSQITVRSLFDAVPGVIHSLQSTKHGSHTDEEFESWVALIGDVVAILVPNRRR